MNNSYKEVKNYIHNEAKITKEEIRDIIRTSVQEEVRKIVTPAFINSNIDKTMEQWVRKGLDEKWYETYKNIVGNKLHSEISKQVVERLDINISLKEK